MRENDFPGTLIVIEGADGSGTTTQSRLLSEEIGARRTAEHGERREGEHLIGEKVEEMITEGGYSPEAIALGFAADRMVHLEERLIPLLKKGETVVCDRYYHSSLVYQPALGAEEEWVREINREAVQPDITVVLDVAAETGMERIDSRGADDNIFEDLSFQQEVVQRYRRLPEKLDEEIVPVDASYSIDKVAAEVRDAVRENV